MPPKRSNRYTQALEAVAARRGGLKLNDPEFFQELRAEYRKRGGQSRKSTRRASKASRTARKVLKAKKTKKSGRKQKRK